MLLKHERWSGLQLHSSRISSTPRPLLQTCSPA